MPKVTHSAVAKVPVEIVWTFAKNFGNWVSFLKGYQAHEVINDRDSVWTLKAEVGGLTRTTKLRVHITEWKEPERVTFSIEGVNEPIHGGGSVEVRPYTSEAASGSATLITVVLMMNFGGFLAPVFNLSIGPLLKHIGEELAVKLVAAVEEIQRSV